MKLWPRSTAGQLVALLLLGLLATQLLAVVFLRLNAQMLNPVSRDQVLERMAISYRVIQISSMRDEASMLDAMGSDIASFWIEDRPPTPHTDMTREEQQILYSLAAKVDKVSAEGLWVQLDQPDDGWLGSFNPRLGWSILPLRAAIELPDGRWLHSLQQPLAGYQWWRLLRFSLPASLLPVMVIVFIFVYRTLRPIKALGRAAERVSRGERIEPLPVVGPSEAREVSAAFNLMQEKLTRFIDDRTRMLAAISHDFRTPITSLRLRVELIDDPALRSAMTRTLDEMRQMVEQTLRFTHDDAQGEATQDIDLQALLAEVEADHRAMGRDVTLETHDAAPYRARPVSLKRAVGNLVDNAVRHGRCARLRLSTHRGIRIEIDDDGPGLAAGDLERVFEPFFQLDPARNHEAGGVGLGLSIARSCARAHGGDVTLANRPGGGLRATVTLP